MIFRLNRYINVRAVAIAVMMMMTAALHVVAQSPAAGDTCRCNGVSSELSIAATPSLVLRSNPFLRGHNQLWKPVSASFSGRLQYAMRFAPDSEYGRLYPYAWQGIGLGVTSFSASGVLGSPVALYVLQGSRIASVTQRLAFDYEWNFGASFGWKHSSSTDAADRLLYGVGSSVNAYIGLAFMLSYEATPRLTLRFGPEIAHYSNGNTSLPNPGVNRVGLRLSATYRLHGIRPRSLSTDWSGFRPGMSYDITLWGAWRKWGYSPSVNEPYTGSGALEVPGRWLVGGLSFNPLYRFNPVVAAGAAVDLLYDDGANLSAHFEPSSPFDSPRFYRQPLSERIMGGVSLRVEISMPIFSVNIGIGHSVYAPTPRRHDTVYYPSDDDRLSAVKSDLRGFYQMFNLKTRLYHGLYLNTGYRLVDFSKSGNLMLGLGYTWR